MLTQEQKYYIQSITKVEDREEISYEPPFLNEFENS